MRLAGWRVDRVRVLVMFVVHVRVVVVERLVSMRVYVSVEEEQDDSDCHQRAGSDVPDSKRFG